MEVSQNPAYMSYKKLFLHAGIYILLYLLDWVYYISVQNYLIQWYPQALGIFPVILNVFGLLTMGILLLAFISKNQTFNKIDDILVKVYPFIGMGFMLVGQLHLVGGK